MDFKKNLICLVLVLAIASCNSKKEDKVVLQKDTIGSVQKDTIIEKVVVEDTVATKIKDFLVNNFLVNDLKIMDKSERNFQYENVDLNDDGIPETFVRFSSNYFCGSGGCTFLLLDDKQNIITKFTVMDAPIFVERKKIKGWSILLVKSGGVFRELAFNGSKYPSNPSVVPKVPYDAPSSNAIVLFEKPFAEGIVNPF
jgi:hypothetical protein